MSNKEILNSVTAVAGFFLLANGVNGVVQNKEYSVEKIFISAAALSFVGYEKFQPRHKKLKRRLDDLFSDQTILTKGQLLFWDSKSKTKGFGVNKRVFWTKVEIDSDSFNRYIPANMRCLWSNIFSEAIRENLVNGKTIKEAVLRALSCVVLTHIPDFFKNDKIRAYVEKDRLIDVFALKMVHEMYKAIEACQTDEAVIDFLENSFQEKTSLFYGLGLDLKGKTCSFLNRSVYADGKQKEFRFLDASSYTLVASCSFGSLVLSPLEAPLIYSGAMLGTAFLVSFSQMRREKHLRKELARFETKSFRLSEICFKKAPNTQNGTYIVWYQRMKSLTKLERAKLARQTALFVNDFLKKLPQEMLCGQASCLLFFENVLKNAEIGGVYKQIESGATLEEAVAKCGLKPVFKLLMLHHFSQKLKEFPNKELRSFLFGFQDTLISLKEKERLAMKKIGKRMYENLKKVGQLYQNGEITQGEHKNFVIRILEEEEQGVFMQVPMEVKLPKVIQKVLKEERIKD